ncbi:hypothetical protein O1M63_58855 [Streptomyces mirabilis]|nr:hypothetical protein [Streptomyces mirabilis]
MRITGIVEPRHPQGGYWSAEPVLRTRAWPRTPRSRRSSTGTRACCWRPAPPRCSSAARDSRSCTGGSPPPPTGSPHRTSRARLPDRLPRRRARTAADARGGRGTAAVATDLETVVGSYTTTRAAITPVVAVGAFGIGAVAAVVLVMAGGLVAARRAAELALLRARGGSLRGIAGRLLAETAVVAVPAAAAGLLLAVLTVDEARLLPAVLGASAVALLACAVLPVRAVVAHRRPRAHAERDDLAHARPGRRRTVAELTVLVLAVGSGRGAAAARRVQRGRPPGERRPGPGRADRGAGARTAVSAAVAVDAVRPREGAGWSVSCRWPARAAPRRWASRCCCWRCCWP